MAGEQLVEGTLVEHQQLTVGLGGRRGRTRRAGEQRHLTEELAVGEVGEDLLVAAGVTGRQANAAAGHDEERVAGISLAAEDLCLGQPALAQQLSDGLELFRGDRLEDVHRAKEVSYAHVGS